MAEGGTDRFKRNYYGWALHHWETEIKQGFPRLSGIPSRNTDRTLAVLRTLAPDRQPEIVRAMTKRFHPEAAGLLGEALSPDERILLSAFDQARSAAVSPELVMGSGAVRKEMRSLLQARLGFLGTRAPLEGPSSWVHSLSTEAWIIETRVEALGKFCEASISHRLKERTSGLVVDFVSYSAALGVSSLTNWSLSDPSCTEAAADGIANLCQWFLSELVLLLELPTHPMKNELDHVR